MHKKAYIVTLATLAATLTVAPAAVSFEPPVSYSVGGGPRDIASADVNQDGVPDVITAPGSPCSSAPAAALCGRRFRSPPDPALRALRLRIWATMEMWTLLQ
jgi:hypothetical protein